MKCLQVNVNSNDWKLIPLCCIHFPLGEQDLLQDWVEKLKEPNTYGFLLGDSMDEYRTHYRKHIKSYVEDENSPHAQFNYHRKEIEKLAKILKPVAKKIWGVTRGNHYVDFPDGTNSEQYLCQLLGIDYFGVIGMLRVSMPNHCESSRSIIKVLVHHHGGTNGPRTESADIAALMRLRTEFDMDVYIAGHTHRKYYISRPLLTVTERGEPVPTERTLVYIRAGSLLKGYKKDEPNAHDPHFPSYTECGAMGPTELGYVTLRIRTKRGKEKGASPIRVIYEATY